MLATAAVLGVGVLHYAHATTCYGDTCQPKARILKDAGAASTFTIVAEGFDEAGLEVKITTLAMSEARNARVGGYSLGAFWGWAIPEAVPPPCPFAAVVPLEIAGSDGCCRMTCHGILTSVLTLTGILIGSLMTLLWCPRWPYPPACPLEDQQRLRPGFGLL